MLIFVEIENDGSEGRASSENGACPFCNHFLIIPCRLACGICTEYFGIKLVGAVWRSEEKKDILSLRAQDVQLFGAKPFISHSE